MDIKLNTSIKYATYSNLNRIFAEKCAFAMNKFDDSANISIC